MKISEFVKNITEFQSKDFIKNMGQEDRDQMESNLWLVWQKLQLIDDFEIFLPLSDISEALSKIKDVPNIVKKNNKFFDINFFYDLCIENIPKRKYKFMHPIKNKKKVYDQEFLEYLSMELQESTKNCKGFYDIFQNHGKLEEEKKRLLVKYGVDINDDGEPSGEPLESTSKHKIWLYEIEAEKIKKLGYKDRKKILGDSSLRKYIFKETGISQSKYYQLKYILDNSPDELENIDSGHKTVRNVYRRLKNLDSEAKIKERVIKQFKKQVLELSNHLSKEQIIHIIKNI
ncbi:hypothetical protein [Maribacter arcticus]|uniref:Uncharacterized protein n=1 Tax=Maribacter arcticus TaxID=561365 RepID=A0A1T5ED32_9FLAO|nr:hypothetical protein [Maribacter arcticus]SKB81793.1 hypothetical protein SAMN05660866_03438 [Maribacter arcticus]